MASIATRLIPAWLRHYSFAALPADVIAGLVVGILVIPQSLGYAVLAGLPPVYGLYAAIVPVIVYAWIGSSNVQAVGPVAILAASVRAVSATMVPTMGATRRACRSALGSR